MELTPMTIRTVANPPALLVLAGLFLAGQPPAAQAATFCALSGDQLRTMLTTAASNGQADQIRVTTGVKKTSTSFPLRWSFVTSEDHGLELSGGWNGGCTQQVAGPRATVLDGDGTDEVIRFQFQADSTAEVSMSNLTVANGRSTNNGSSGGLRVEAFENAVPRVLLEQLVVRMNEAPSAVGAVHVSTLQQSAGTYTVRNTLIEANLQVGLTVALGANATAYINQNTITGNAPVAFLTGGVSIAGPGQFWMANNAIALNTGTQLRIAPSVPSILRNNLIGSLTGTPGSQMGTLSGDPQWALDGRGYWRPLPGSPLIDSGFPSPNGGSGNVDLDGDARLFGGVLDRGAREVNDVVFAHGFD
jgi:hypothetical protein